jgi:hypothetical protein
VFVHHVAGFEGGDQEEGGDAGCVEGGGREGGGRGVRLVIMTGLQGGREGGRENTTQPTKQRAKTYRSLSSQSAARPGCNMGQWARRGGGSRRPGPGTRWVS